MSGRGEGGKVKGKSKSRTRVQFPVGRLHRLLRKSNHAKSVDAGAPVYLAAVLKYLAAQVLELAGQAAREEKKIRIIPRHLQLVIRNDAELNKLMSGVTIIQGEMLHKRIYYFKFDETYSELKVFVKYVKRDAAPCTEQVKMKKVYTLKVPVLLP
ncbi:histone H2A-like [Babylonia areolata]|uniref:histone H2A-like n=1 Tax=Babylonia areolata TaxID=304850 RepID=UPI003FD3C07D